MKRRDKIMEQPAMLSALHLDPRFSFELDDQQELAIKNIVKTYKRLSDLEHEHREEEDLRDLQEMPSSDTDSFSTVDDDDARYERLLKRKHCVKTVIAAAILSLKLH